MVRLRGGKEGNTKHLCEVRGSKHGRKIVIGDRRAMEGLYRKDPQDLKVSSKRGSRGDMRSPSLQPDGFRKQSALNEYSRA